MPDSDPQPAVPLRTTLPHLERIVLTGFMGAGKTTVGRILAARIGWPFADLDDIIEYAAGRTIAEIFREEGEPAFRERESLALADALTLPKTILALGGGAIERPANLDRIRATPATLLVFLNAPLAHLLDRLNTQSASGVRPLLLDIPSLQRRYESRMPAYHSADCIVDTLDRTPEQAAEEIFRQLRS